MYEYLAARCCVVEKVYVWSSVEYIKQKYKYTFVSM